MPVLLILIPLAIILVTIMVVSLKRPWLAIGLAVLTGFGAYSAGRSYWRHSGAMDDLRNPAGRFEVDLATPGDYISSWQVPESPSFCHGFVFCIETDPPLRPYADFDFPEQTRRTLEGLKFEVLLEDETGRTLSQEAYDSDDVFPGWVLSPQGERAPAFRVRNDLPRTRCRVIVRVAEGAGGLISVPHYLTARHVMEFLPMITQFEGLIAFFFLIVFLLNALGAGLIIWRNRRRIAGVSASSSP
jgi:hypothetical protein